MIRSIVLFVLLICVPFQAAVGATGLVCPNGSHHSSSALVDEHGAPATHDHHGLDALDAHDHAASDQTPGNDEPGKCSICSECCFSAAPVAAFLPDFVAPDAALKVSGPVDSAMRSRAGDNLFRPPRSIAV
jgi:hypothetical protein